MANQIVVKFGDTFYLKHENSCPIVYGDRIRIINVSYSNQRLVEPKYQGYITTKL